MAAEDFDVDIDLQTNALLNACLQVLSSDPTGKAGRVYINSTDDPQTLRFYDADASVWRQAGLAYTAGDGLGLTGLDFAVKVAAGAGGIEISSDQLRISTGAAGDGLTGGGGAALAVNPGSGLEISSDAVRIAAAAAGAGLTGGAGSALAVGAGTGITVNADDVAVDTAVIASKSYVDTVVQGLKPKQSVRVATTANLSVLGGALNSGDTIDGVTLANGDRVLVKDQSSPADNGIYIVAASPYRAPDADSWNELVGAWVVVEDGTVNSDSTWLCTSNQGGTLGTNNVTWSAQPSLSALIAGYGLVKTGNQVDVGQGDGITTNADDVAVNSTVARRNADNTISGNVIASKATTTTNPVVSGTTSSSGIGVKGESSTGYGVSGVTSGGSGAAGVWGTVLSGSGAAIAGLADSGIGVSGSSTTGVGVQGMSLGSAAAFKVGPSHASGPVFDGANKGAIVNISDGVNDDDAATLGQSGRGYKTTIGNGSSTTFTVNHALGTRDVIVEVYILSGTYETRGCRIERTDANNVEVKFNSAPANNSRRVLVRSV